MSNRKLAWLEAEKALREAREELDDVETLLRLYSRYGGEVGLDADGVDDLVAYRDAYRISVARLAAAEQSALDDYEAAED